MPCWHVLSVCIGFSYFEKVLLKPPHIGMLLSSCIYAMLVRLPGVNGALAKQYRPFGGSGGGGGGGFERGRVGRVRGHRVFYERPDVISLPRTQHTQARLGKKNKNTNDDG